jgi:hypothetical protein
MNTAEVTGAQRAAETFVIAKTDEGYRVCSPLEPGRQYVVTGLPDQPQCTCQEFASHDGDPQWLCPHILAVLKETEAASQSPSTAPAGSRGSGNPPARTTKTAPSAKNGESAVMLLKRSVSPDGRIDSLSVEFSCPIGKETPETLKERAAKILALQADIASGFLKTNGNGVSPRNGSAAATAVAAQLLAVASMNGRYGKRLFLNVLVNGQVLKFFGSEKQLAEAVTSAGYANVADHLVDGFALNLPCRVVTKPSQDGKYVNIDQVLPAQAATPK